MLNDVFLSFYLYICQNYLYIKNTGILSSSESTAIFFQASMTFSYFLMIFLTYRNFNSLCGPLYQFFFFMIYIVAFS